MSRDRYIMDGQGHVTRTYLIDGVVRDYDMSISYLMEVGFTWNEAVAYCRLLWKHRHDL
jgi:hypothetical protein